MINLYSENIDISSIVNFHFIDNIFIHKHKGILSELWFTNKYHDKISNYDYILFILDDVNILNIDIKKLICIKNKYDIEFLSPKVLDATWQYMKHKKYSDLALTNRIEIYCILLNPRDFYKFMSLNDINNPNIWGVDYIMSHFNIRTGVYQNNVVEHILKSSSDHLKATKQMTLFLNKHGYSSDKEIKNKFPTEIIKFIKITD